MTNAAFVSGIVQTIAVVIQTLLGLAAILLAFREVRKWRTELLGSRKIELAIKLGYMAKTVNEVFKSGRGAWGQKAPEYKPNTTEADRWKQDREYDFNERLKLIQSKLEPLNELSWEMSALFDDYQEIEVQVGQYNRKFNELRVAMQMEYHERGQKDFTDVIYGGYDNANEFSRDIEIITNKLQEFAHKHIHGK